MIQTCKYFYNLGDVDEKRIRTSAHPKTDSSTVPYLFFSQNNTLYRKEIEGFSIFDEHQLVHRYQLRTYYTGHF